MNELEKQKLTWGDLWRAARVPLSYVGEHRKTATLLTILAFISAAMGAAVPYAVGRFVDALIALSQGVDMTAWVWPLSLWFGVMLVSTIVDWRLSVMASRMGHLVYYTAASRWFSKLLFFPSTFHKQVRGGKTLNKISRASGRMYRLVQNILLTIGPQVLSMFIGVGFAYVIEPRLTIVIIVGMCIYGVISLYTALSMAELQLLSNRAESEVYGDVWDALGNIYTVKQTTAEANQEQKILTGFLEKSYTARMNLEVVWNRIVFLQRASVMGTMLAIFLGSVYFVSTGEMSVGSLVALNGYAALVFGPLASIAMQWHVIQEGLTTIYEVGEIMQTNPEEYERKDGVTPKEWKGNTAFKAVSFAYPDAPDRTILFDVSFEMQNGETVAFVGESGVGKSTAIELIGGYYYPTSGEVLVSGVPTTKLPLRLLREHIAVVPQEPVLFNDSVMVNIRFGRVGASDEEVIDAAKKAFAHEFIETFPEKYNQLVGERGVKLSVGQKQRIAIARAILRNPKILILDEPTSALDAKTESQLTQSLEELMKGRTTIIIAHRLSTVRKADNIIVFEGGKVVEQGKHIDLIAKENGVYRKLYEYQIGLHA
jgi:ABC-type multidrug transport system fused ATPase/permease subunit